MKKVLAGVLVAVALFTAFAGMGSVHKTAEDLPATPLVFIWGD
ncbi:hypothetical protein [Tumebacillus flagellatus]|nr:hypothetical protein [Tumebacillus flagellatus]